MLAIFIFLKVLIGWPGLGLDREVQRERVETTVSWSLPAGLLTVARCRWAVWGLGTPWKGSDLLFYCIMTLFAINTNVLFKKSWRKEGEFSEWAFSFFLYILFYYGLLQDRVPCTIQWALIIYPLYIQKCVYVTPSLSLPLSSLVAISFFSMFLFLFCK